MNKQTDVCSLQGFSVRPVILYSLFEGLALILRLLSIFLAWDRGANTKIEMQLLQRRKREWVINYLGPVNLVRISSILICQKEVYHWPWLHNHCCWCICKLKHYTIMIWGRWENAVIFLVNNLPMFNDRPPWVTRKLEWKPLHPKTPPPSSVKFLGSSW